MKAVATVNAFAADKDYASLPRLMAQAKAVLVYPQIIEGGFIIGGPGGTGVLQVREAIRRGSVTSVRQLVQRIDHFVTAYNTNFQPFK